MKAKLVGSHIFALFALLYVGCSEEKPSSTFVGQKFSTAPGSDQGAFVVNFSDQVDHSITVHLVEEGKATQVWSGKATVTDQNTAPYVAITTYGESPNDTTPTRLHVLTSSGDQQIVDLPEGKPSINLLFNSGKLSGRTIIFDCATFPEEYDGNFPKHDGHWRELETYVEKSENSGWRYIVVQGEIASELAESD